MIKLLTYVRSNNERLKTNMYRQELFPRITCTKAMPWERLFKLRERLKAMPHGSDFYNEFAKIHQIYEKTYRAMEFLTKLL